MVALSPLHNQPEAGHTSPRAEVFKRNRYEKRRARQEMPLDGERDEEREMKHPRLEKQQINRLERRRRETSGGKEISIKDTDNGIRNRPNKSRTNQWNDWNLERGKHVETANSHVQMGIKSKVKGAKEKKEDLWNMANEKREAALVVHSKGP